jgi:hypothetical protein
LLAIEEGRALAQVKPTILAALPIRNVDGRNVEERAQQKTLMAQVERMLNLKKQLSTARAPHEKTALQRQIDTADRNIDASVYEIYGLTEKEIEIVEVSTQKERHSRSE